MFNQRSLEITYSANAFFSFGSVTRRDLVHPSRNKAAWFFDHSRSTFLTFPSSRRLHRRSMAAPRLASFKFQFFRNTVLSCAVNWGGLKLKGFCQEETNYVLVTLTEECDFLFFALLTWTFKSSTKVFRLLNGSSQIFATCWSEKLNVASILSTWL